MRFLSLMILFACAMLWAQGKELLGNVNVSKVNSMDEVKGSYKSPKKAMFMSLLLPGSGQMYVGGQSRYIRGTFYLAEEIALISGLYYHSIYKYDKQVNDYKNFADKNFSVSQYENAMNDIYDINYEENFKTLYGTGRDSYCKAFFGDTNLERCSNFNKQPYTHPDDNTPLRDPAAYYQAIANENFVLGWRDVEPNGYVVTNLYSNPPNPNVKLGTSENYEKYIDMRRKANNLADRQAIFLGIIILNHIVSAVDAALSANAHNSSLYEERLSFLDKIRLGSDFQIGENFRAGAGLVLSF